MRRKEKIICFSLVISLAFFSIPNFAWGEGVYNSFLVTPGSDISSSYVHYNSPFSFGRTHSVTFWWDTLIPLRYMSPKGSIPFWTMSDIFMLYNPSFNFNLYSWYNIFNKKYTDSIFISNNIVPMREEHKERALEFIVAEPIIQNQNVNKKKYVNELLVMFTTPTLIDRIIHPLVDASWIQVGHHKGLFRVPIPEGVRIEEMIEQYKQNPAILYVEPNYLRKAHLTVNDPYYPYQWHLDSLSAQFAWDLGSGSGTVVALLDSGVAYRTSGSYVQAPDLSGTLFAPGYDFVNNDPFPDDDNSHGTFMAGCIAQTTNNLLGAAGVAFNTTIMPIKVMDADGYVSIADEILGIYYAVDNGADIINLSFGGEEISHIERTAIEYAYGMGVTVVSSAGNSSSSIPHYPASCEYPISVSAIQYNRTRAPYSNYGTTIDVCAPGGNLMKDDNHDNWPDGIVQQNHDGSDFTVFHYFLDEGTSIACALVSGVAALIIDKSSQRLTPLQIKETLEKSAVDLGPEGWDHYYGWGAVNAHDALLTIP